MLPGREPLGRYRSYVRPMRYKASTSLCTVTPLDRRCIYGASVGRFCFLLSSDTVISLDVAPFVCCPASHWSRYTAMSMPISHPSPKDVEWRWWRTSKHWSTITPIILLLLLFLSLHVHFAGLLSVVSFLAQFVTLHRGIF